MTRSRVLITGFGPFPGVTENVSGPLAERLARSKLFSHPAYPLHAELLPTDWQEVSTRGPRLLAGLKPRLILHLGLSQRARAFRIERSAHNRVMAKEDARGALPLRSEILERGQPRIDTPVPAIHIAKHLRSQGIPAIASRSAGSYLCNFLYYLSLDWALRQKRPCDVCFVHVPAPALLSETDILRGAELILSYLLAHTKDADGLTAAHRTRAAQPMAARTG